MEQFLSGKWGRGLLLEYVFLEVVTVLLARRELSVVADPAAPLCRNPRPASGDGPAVLRRSTVS